MKKEYMVFLDSLRKSGITNMFGAAPYLSEEFEELSIREARNVLTYWMENFGKHENWDYLEEK